MKTSNATVVILTAGTLALATAAALPVWAQEPASKPDPNVAKTPPRLAAADQWRALRVGLFIHWGPSSGKALPQSHSHARKSVLNPHGSVPAEVYDQFYQEFNPTNYHPNAWLKLAHDAGMRYAIFVAKHHDGFCMFKSILKHTGTLGGPPILDFKPVRARLVRLELGKFRPHPLEVSELRLFAPLEPLAK